MTNKQHALLLLVSDIEQNYKTKATVFTDMGVLRVDIKIDQEYTAGGSYNFIHDENTPHKAEVRLFENLLSLSEGFKPLKSNLYE